MRKLLVWRRNSSPFSDHRKLRPDEAACAEWLLERRWGSGFACPECGHDGCWRLGRKVLTLQCRACRRETSVTAGTVMHRSHLPLKVWFTAAWLVATHRNGMSARQLWLQLGLGSYKSAWLLLRKLRAAMVDPDREPLAGLVEVDETSLPFRGGGEPARPGRSHDGKLLIAGAVEIRGKGPGRTRLAVIEDYSAVALGAFVAAVIAAGSTVVSDGWSGYARLKDVKHDPRVVGDAPAHAVLPWNPPRLREREAVGAGGLSRAGEKHLQAYLDEFVFRFNRRRTPQAAFSRLLGLAGHDRTTSLRRPRRIGLKGISHSTENGQPITDRSRVKGSARADDRGAVPIGSRVALAPCRARSTSRSLPRRRSRSGNRRWTADNDLGARIGPVGIGGRMA